jgi:8-oxo-dGTP pyrophosphatase MutT (NUDIX family)
MDTMSTIRANSCGIIECKVSNCSAEIHQCKVCFSKYHTEYRCPENEGIHCGRKYCFCNNQRRFHGSCTCANPDHIPYLCPCHVKEGNGTAAAVIVWISPGSLPMILVQQRCGLVPEQFKKFKLTFPGGTCELGTSESELKVCAAIELIEEAGLNVLNFKEYKSFRRNQHQTFVWIIESPVAPRMSGPDKVHQWEMSKFMYSTRFADADKTHAWLTATEVIELIHQGVFMNYCVQDWDELIYNVMQEFTVESPVLSRKRSRNT